jgi:hypothetical protein
VKKKRLYIAVLVLLGSALIFNQVGLPFFHDSHKAHEFFEASKQGQSLLLPHGEHCEVCSLEILFSVILPISTEVPRQVFVSEYNRRTIPGTVFVFSERARNKAPPTM